MIWSSSPSGFIRIVFWISPFKTSKVHRLLVQTLLQVFLDDDGL